MKCNQETLNFPQIKTVNKKKRSSGALVQRGLPHWWPGLWDPDLSLPRSLATCHRSIAFHASSPPPRRRTRPSWTWVKRSDGQCFSSVNAVAHGSIPSPGAKNPFREFTTNQGLTQRKSQQFAFHKAQNPPKAHTHTWIDLKTLLLIAWIEWTDR